MSKIERVAIVGIGLSHVDYITNVCKVGNRKAVADEVWAINKMGAAIHCDAIFRMDDLMKDFSMNQKYWKKQDGEHIKVQDIWNETLKNFEGKIFTSKAYPEEFPASVEYPLEEVVNYIGSSYFNTGPAYAIAYAIYIGVKEISLYGLDYSYADRHVAESGRGCVEYHLREAQMRGIDIRVGRNSTLLDTQKTTGKMYGYSHPVEVIPDPDNPDKFKVVHRHDLAEKQEEEKKEQELAELERLMNKYKPELLDTPDKAIQEESLEGDFNNDKSNEIHKGSYECSL